MIHSKHLIKTADNRIIGFPFLSKTVRMGYVIMAVLLIAASMLFYLEQHRFPLLGGILSLFSILVLCYKDEWQFNCTDGTITYGIGLVFSVYTKHYTFADIEKTETERFMKGFRKQEYMKCKLRFKTGEQKTVTIFPVQRNQHLVRQWETLAASFTVDTDFDG